MEMMRAIDWKWTRQRLNNNERAVGDRNFFIGPYGMIAAMPPLLS